MKRLRGHHLICLRFFKGEGYSREFSENIWRILKNDRIEVIFGADDVCIKCPHLENDVCKYSDNSEENVTELDQMAYRLLEIYPDSTVSWENIREKIPEIMKVWKEFACSDCDWKNVCESNEEWKRY